MEGTENLKWKPLGNRLIVKRDFSEKKVNGVIIPDQAIKNDERFTGTVLAIGPGRLLDNGNMEPMEVVVGDRILFSRYAGTQQSLDNGEMVLLMTAADAQAIILAD